MHVLGTAGHVDHGKSTLIQALTGIDPDRLAEEKKRGLTIDLGFAWMNLPSGREIGIVDVPGHERFVHNMLAGVGSIDATIFVVSANEGWMPQSEEHMQILDLLGARGGIVALTKTDLVDEDTLLLVEGELRERLEGTVLEHAAIVRVSARSGDGIDALRAALDGVLDRTPQSADTGRPRLFVDRSFTIKGAGTVVTGTLNGGTLRIDDDVLIVPAGERARVRTIQTHRRARDLAEPGSRVALNLAGLERQDIKRGDAVVRPGQWQPTHGLGVLIRAVRSLTHPLTGRGAHKLYIGSAEVDARLTLLDASALRAGEEGLARLVLAAEVIATEGDRFVLRDSGRRETVAGGIVLDAHPAPERIARQVITERLEHRARVGSPDAGAFALVERGVIAADDVKALTGRDDIPGAVRLRSFLLDPAHSTALVTRIEASLQTFHVREPLAKGAPRDDVRKASGIADPKLFAEIVEHASDRFVGEGALLRLATHRVSLDPAQQAAREEVLSEAAGTTPPSIAQLEQAHGAKLVRALVDAGDLVKISGELVFTAKSLEDIRRQIAEAISSEGPLAASRLREILGTTRKFAIPLLEYLDAAGFTKRDGDLRSLRSRNS